MPNLGFKTIPIEGKQIEGMYIHGNGKDCELVVEIKDLEFQINIPMRDPKLNITMDGKISTKSFNYGDTDLGIEYIFLENMKIVKFEIDFPDDDQSWQECLKEFENGKGDFIDWMIESINIHLDKESNEKET